MADSPASNPANPEATVQPSGPRVRVTWVKSAIGYSERQKRTIAALGLHRLGHTVEKPDTFDVRAMVKKVCHLVKLEEVK